MTAVVRALDREAEKLLACIHCGLCVSACPTYLQLGDENDSPRGRLYLMRAAAEGRLPMTSEALTRHIDLCLGCRACETVCPSGVHYGRILEAMRADLARQRVTIGERSMRFLLNHIFTSPRRLKWFLAPARWLRRRASMRKLLEREFLPTRLQLALELLMATSSEDDAALSPSNQRRASPSPLPRDAKRRVAFFAGCVARELFEWTNRATKDVLIAHGCAVEDPPDQVCCGALHAHAGEIETARALARRNIRLFERHTVEAIVVNVAGCGAMLKEYGELLAEDPEYAARARAFAARVRDISEYLVEIGLRPGPRPMKLTVTYDAPCHLYHAQRVTTAPLEVIRRIPGITFVPLVESEMCCGSAGIYNLRHPELAERLLQRKLEHLRRTGADVLLTGNAGCLMYLRRGVRRAGLPIRVMHPIELLALTYE
ncbi:MAG: heterodisulfide reductase-related iron-sulfur binding cluster [Blastocatellia bacterium]|nr:heterodisulfide reductase-related iron-sulfur binding cluster [Blastocatellia bacterium]MDW8167006.1 heterodisulfide reductase-related iron-sulfur binding cluster [Acidobacteriota bacterium]MDW8257110.1 heterodisulfide reductase-related iron-sulfur binding cluster [Acidobacteriota bacterium]